MRMVGLRRPLQTRRLLQLTLLATIVLAVFTFGLPVSAAAATVTDLKAVHRNGQTFITFTKNAGSGPKTTYDVYRHTSPITSFSGPTKVATVDADSWHSLYDDKVYSTPHLSNGFIIENDGSPLASTQGLLVWTTATNGCYYYAVANSNDTSTISAGTNSLMNCVTEAHQTVPGAVRLQATINNSSYLTYKYFRWEDYSTWQTRQWGYYGHRFNVYAPVSGSPSGIELILHSAQTGYIEPSDTLGHQPAMIEIMPQDLSVIAGGDPYAPDNPGYGHSYWFGRYDTVSDEVWPITETRIVDYVKLVRDNATGDGTNFNADGNRAITFGASLGSAAWYVAAHNPDTFAFAFASLLFVDPTYVGVTVPAKGKIVHGVDQTYENWVNLKWLADHGYRLPPTSYTFNKDDFTLNQTSTPAALTALEAAKLPFAAAWGGHTRATPGDLNGHAQFAIDNTGSGGPWDLSRFVLNEAHPAFSNSSNSDPVGTAPQAAGTSGNVGQRNSYLDWGSAIHPIGPPIEDTVNSFGITLKALSADAAADVTIRNAQQFRPNAGQSVSWRNESQQTGQVLQSGSVSADRQGLVTVRLQITAGGNRLTLSCSTCTAPAVGTATTRDRETPAVGRVPPPPNVRIVRP